MGKLEKNIYKITWPIFIEMMFFTLLGTVDTFMLSQYSDTSVGSVGISNQILFLFGIFVNVIAIGVGVVSAQYLGAKQIENAKDTIVTGITTNIIIGSILSAIIILFGNIFLQWVGTSNSFMVDSVSYLRIVGYSIVFIAIRVSLSTGFRSFSRPKIVMVIMILGNVVNIGLNAILIYGLIGLPALGVVGAAIGTLISRILMVIILLIASYKVLKIKVFKLRVHLNHLKKILFVGIPSAMENLMWNVAQVAILYFINQMSDEAVIARSYIRAILPFVFMFSFSLAVGNSIIVGYHMGENKPDKAYKHTLKSLRIALVFVMMITVLLNLFSGPIIHLFTDNLEIIKIIKNVLYISVIIELGRAMNLVYIQALRSVGDTVFPVIMAVISMFGIAVIFSYIFGIRMEMGIVGVYLASMIDEVLRGLTMATRWYLRKWVSIKLIDSKA
ncbi:MAG: MATE family efflux transporter [Candidatus Izimaplasma sp.]|nr:MATE family efflux transporter [Candidatus Izimaplasma bacterium]